MKRLIVLIIIGILAPGIEDVNAQRSELGIFSGVSSYLGDLNPDNLYSQVSFSGGVGYKYNISSRWAFKVEGAFARIQGDDKLTGNPRNLNFRNDLLDFSAQLEVNFLRFFTGLKTYKFSPYLTFGATLFFSNPKAYYNDPVTKNSYWIDLRPLGTEGQGSLQYPDKKIYSAAQFAIPFGIGFKYSVNKRVNIGLEWSMRKTFTDYLDDVSGQYVDPSILSPEGAIMADRSEVKNPVGSYRGDPSKKDWYSMAVFKLMIKIGNPNPTPCNAYKESTMDRYKKKSASH